MTDPCAFIRTTTGHLSTSDGFVIAPAWNGAVGTTLAGKVRK
jgi:hypothetical protein